MVGLKIRLVEKRKEKKKKKEKRLKMKRAEAENDRKFLELARREMWQKCPICSIYVERHSGCEHIQCRFVFSKLYFSY
jgi:E3 ubiquitin-protein ligase RNF144